MSPSRWAVLLLTLALCTPTAASGQDRWRFEYAGRAPEGLVGNGRSVVRVRPDGIDFHHGGDAHARFRLVLGDSVVDLASPAPRASFLPGGVVYALDVRGTAIEILHGATPDVPWFACARVRHATTPVAIEVTATGAPTMAATGRVRVPLAGGAGEVVLAAGGLPPAGRFEALRAALEAPYHRGLVLETPDPEIDRAVPFCRALLDLGFDGHMHVCEIFRWRDVWSRDLGSGLAPGAMASGRFAAASTTIDYDLGRYAKADPLGLKVTEDPSQGGCAEGVAWLARAVWMRWLLDGDRDELQRAAHTLRPWVEAWIARDADDTGMLVDVSEWMDHSRFFLFPDGARVLYSNVLFADLLRRFATIERTLGDPSAARYDALAARFVRGVNAGLWDETNGIYDNLVLGGLRDERSTSGENALAVLCGVAPEARARRAMDTIRARNWRKAGSSTITPPMSHVPLYIDHNDKVWPWWNAVEARARFRLDDRAGGAWLLGRCAATLADEHYPGMIEELVDPEDGHTEGGFAFLTAAGSYLDAIVEGLLGVEVLEPGCARLRVDPRTPADWKDWHAEVPLPQGAVALTMAHGRLRVRVTDPHVRVVEVPAGAIVEGAARAPLAARAWPALADTTAPHAAPVPVLRDTAVIEWVRDAVVLQVAHLPAPAVPAPTGRRVTLAELATLDPASVGAVIVPGNALPRHAEDGSDVAVTLERWLARGGALVFWGPTMRERGTMGETAGVIEWYDLRPVVRGETLREWRFRLATTDASVARANEPGLRGGWQARAFEPDTSWRPIAVPAGWEKTIGELDGWGWYRAHFRLPADGRGKPVVVELGKIDDFDWTFVNGVEIGSRTNWQAIRHYVLRPGDPAYATLAFGGDNVLAVQVQDTGGGGGIWSDSVTVGVETNEKAWLPIDPRNGEVSASPTRLGVVSWGPGGRFMNSWETSRGVFGWALDGRGVELAGEGGSRPPRPIDTHEVFTDFAVSKPWHFEPLAFTHTSRHLLVPDRGEIYPCAARLRNADGGGEIVLIPSSLVTAGLGATLLERLHVRVLP